MRDRAMVQVNYLLIFLYKTMALSNVEEGVVSLPVSHVADKYFAVPTTASAAKQGGRQINPAISPVSVARLFFSHWCRPQTAARHSS